MSNALSDIVLALILSTTWWLPFLLHELVNHRQVLNAHLVKLGRLCFSRQLQMLQLVVQI